MRKFVELVQPSDDISQAYLHKSRRYLDTSRLLVRHKKFEESISISYYGMYYALLALLRKAGIKSQSHAASIRILKRVFGINSRPIQEAKRERVETQYFVDITVTAEDARELLERAHEFSALLEARIAGIVSADISRFRERFLTVVPSKRAASQR